MNLESDERAFLIANRAIRIEDDGIERYVGLTEQESIAFLTLSRANEAGGLSDSDRTRYEELHAKHEAERQVFARGEKSFQAFQKP